MVVIVLLCEVGIAVVDPGGVVELANNLGVPTVGAATLSNVADPAVGQLP